MAYFVSLKTVNIETDNPNVKNIDSDTSPGWKISCEDWVILNAEALILHDKPHDSQHNDAGSYTTSHIEVFLFVDWSLLSHVSQSLPGIFAFNVFVLFALLHIEVLYLIDIVLFNADHSRYLLMVRLRSWQ